MKKKLIIASLIFGILIITSTYLFAFPMPKTKYVNEDLMEFNKEDFIKVQTEKIDNGNLQYEDVLTDKNKKVADNGTYQLYFDETTSYFYVENSKTKEKWYSNPIDSKNDNQKSTITINYLESSGANNTAKSVNNYKLSINHDESINYNEKGRKTFSVNYVENGFQVLYEIKSLNINYLYIPRFLDKDVYENALSILKGRVDDSASSYDEYSLFQRMYTYSNDKYQIPESNYVGMNAFDISTFYNIFYPVNKEDLIESLGVYTPERVKQENEQNNYLGSIPDFYFEVAVEVKLTNEGIKMSILNNSIKESSAHKITEITAYPLFGAVTYSEASNLGNDGYLFVPDGSGAIINFNNGKGGATNAYKGRVYGSDLAMLPYTEINREKLIFPIYGLVKKNSGFAAIISNGDAMASVNANVSSNDDTYNMVYASFNVREVEAVTMGSGATTYSILLVTNDKVQTDYSISYYFLDETNSSYSGIAKSYQKYLIDYKNLQKNDTSKNPMITLEFLGAYDEKNFFLGIPYTKQKSLTTFKEAGMIVNQFLSKNVNNINILYKGAINGGLTPNISNKAKIENVLGGKKQYKKLEKELESKGINIYINSDVSTVNKYEKPFDSYKYTAKRVSGDSSRVHEYSPATGVFGKEYNHNYVLNPIYYEEIYKRFNKENLFKNLSFDYIGNSLAGSYSKNGLVYKQDSLNIQKELLENMDKSLVISNPLGFAIPYSDYIIDLPTSSTLFSIIDYSIPLTQLVLSGFIDYTTESMNLSTSRSIDFQFLKAIETGSNIKYTLSYKSSEELLNTKYNMYYSTYYKNWLEIITNQYNEMVELQIHEGELLEHRRISQNVYESKYSNNIKIIINYNSHQVEVEGITIQGMNYMKVVE
ncbi:DUF5696 domain-containing protein [Haploplasma axanthum]|uniref:Uncharacterized protein n=1 Tax=Haploplasma axanthum TaxID=29552 RepID=A0A449BCW4_HAPAX|nr:DUF5696 domain-containing protein [Haploplasma axanthum]VEU80301.1 Uncharacterised protein [Haploplasma axanthum]